MSPEDGSMMEDASRLDLLALNRELAGTRFVGQVRHFPSVLSTNSLALAAAQAGERGGVWVADEQTAGRGRGGHAWHSAAGDGLYVSALVVPQIAASRGMWISLATGLAVQAAIREASGLASDIRWPNDLLLSGKKCGGILVESAVAAARGNATETLRYAVIGVGINVRHESFPEELRAVATSLRMEAGRVIARQDLLRALLRHLDDELRWLDEEQGGAVEGRGLLERFAAASTWVRGRRVRVGEGEGYTGVTAGLGPDGFLRVEADDGSLRTVLSGGVRELDRLQS